jgi:hypothetical protein
MALSLAAIISEASSLLGTNFRVVAWQPGSLAAKSNGSSFIGCKGHDGMQVPLLAVERRPTCLMQQVHSYSRLAYPSWGPPLSTTD